MSKRTLKGGRVRMMVAGDVDGRAVLAVAKIDRAGLGQTGNTRAAMARFVGAAVTGGGLLAADPATGRLAPSVLATKAAERAVADAAPAAFLAFRKAAAMVRASVTDTAAGRVLDGADVFQDAALAVLESGPDAADAANVAAAAALAVADDADRRAAVAALADVDGFAAADRATARTRRRHDRRAAPAPMEAAADVAAPVDRPDAAPAVRALAVWSAMGKRDRERVRRAMAGQPETTGTVLAALAALGFDCRD